MHARRILRGQDPPAPALQLVGRRAAERGCDIQRPAEMFSGMTQADAQAVMRADLVIEAADERELLRQRRRLLCDAAQKLTADLAGQPGSALRAAADHHGV